MTTTAVPFPTVVLGGQNGTVQLVDARMKDLAQTWRINNEGSYIPTRQRKAVTTMSVLQAAVI